MGRVASAPIDSLMSKHSSIPPSWINRDHVCALSLSEAPCQPPKRRSAQPPPRGAQNPRTPWGSEPRGAAMSAPVLRGSTDNPWDVLVHLHRENGTTLLSVAFDNQLLTRIPKCHLPPWLGQPLLSKTKCNDSRSFHVWSPGLVEKAKEGGEKLTPSTAPAANFLMSLWAKSPFTMKVPLVLQEL